jgi:hypothetical protein
MLVLAGDHQARLVVVVFESLLGRLREPEHLRHPPRGDGRALEHAEQGVRPQHDERNVCQDEEYPLLARDADSRRA